MKFFLILIFGFCFQLWACQFNYEAKDSLSFPEKSEFLKMSLQKFGDSLAEYQTNKFNIYCKIGSFADSNISFLKNDTGEAIVRIKEVLNIQKLPNAFYVIVVESRDEMKNFVGIRHKGMTSLENDLIFLVYNQNTRAYIRHELFHLAAFRLWGRPSNRILDEGGAMYADSICLNYDNPIIVLNKYLFENNLWFPFNDLKDNFNKLAHENDMIAYLQSALIFKYLYENYGLEKIEELWKNGFDNFSKIYGFDYNDLKNRLIKLFISTDSENVDWNELMQKGCG